VGLIGLGEIGQVHAAAIQRSRTARLVAVADTAPELLAPFEAQGVRGYREVAELIADAEVGTVSICLPHYLHFPVAREAIRAGQNVPVEKPLSVSLEEGQSGQRHGLPRRHRGPGTAGDRRGRAGDDQPLAAHL
jgi:UDP-N-acetyl-2-amino-2-deoxyglucuronate dehydrogenase